MPHTPTHALSLFGPSGIFGSENGVGFGLGGLLGLFEKREAARAAQNIGIDPRLQSQLPKAGPEPFGIQNLLQQQPASPFSGVGPQQSFQNQQPSGLTNADVSLQPNTAARTFLDEIGSVLEDFASGALAQSLQPQQPLQQLTPQLGGGGQLGGQLGGTQFLQQLALLAGSGRF